MNGEIHKCKNDYSWNFSTCIFDNKYLKSIVDTSVIACDGFISGDCINDNDEDCSNRCINKLTQ